jgi:hypothetical protein
MMSSAATLQCSTLVVFWQAHTIKRRRVRPQKKNLRRRKTSYGHREYHHSYCVSFHTVLRGTNSFVQQLRPDLRRISHLLCYHFVRVRLPEPSLTPWLNSEDVNFFQLQMTEAEKCILICYQLTNKFSLHIFTES